MPPAKTRVPAVEGWFTIDERSPALLGQQVHDAAATSPSPRRPTSAATRSARAPSSTETELSRDGHRSGPTPTPATSRPKPYVAADPYVPFALAAVELAAEQMVVMGQVVPGVGVDDLSVGTEVELVLDTLYEDDEHEYLVWKWRPDGAAPAAAGAAEADPMPDDKRVAVLGAGMHPWGKWGRNFVEYGLAAAGRRPRATPASPGRTSSSWPAPTPSATATPASWPAPPSPRPWAGPVPGSPRPTPPARRGPRPSTTPGPRSWPGCATWPWWSGPTPPPRASSPPWAATARTTRTGSAST